MIAIVVSILLRMYLFTNIYQQSFYEYKNVLRFFWKNIIVFSLSFAVFFINHFIDNIFITILSYIVVIFECRYFLTRLIKPLNITKRVIRLWIVVIILCIPLYFLNMLYLCNVLVLFFIYVANVINKPFEYLINNKYLKKAKLTYDSSKSVKIAITGSYGKTSVKNYLSETLKSKYLVLSTPKSYNTPLGISKFINSSNLDMINYLILEFGARRVGDIKELGCMFNIDIAIVTEIGIMHIDTFNTIENIICEKMRVLNYLSSDGFAILNYENEYIRNYEVSCNNYTYGFNYGDFIAKNISLSIHSTQFDLYYKGNFVTNIKLNLLGRQSILNIMPSIIMCYLLGVPYDNLSNIKSVINRLSMRRMTDFYILDDGYNSNIVGAKYALEVLKTHSGKKYIITPGFVEMDKEKDMLIKEFSNGINTCCDVCILVKNEFTKLLSNYLSSNIKAFFVNSFDEGYKIFIENKSFNSILLIENDLPDAY